MGWGTALRGSLQKGGHRGSFCSSDVGEARGRDAGPRGGGKREVWRGSEWGACLRKEKRLNGATEQCLSRRVGTAAEKPRGANRVCALCSGFRLHPLSQEP